jgi:hypothetical protein
MFFFLPENTRACSPASHYIKQNNMGDELTPNVDG